MRITFIMLGLRDHSTGGYSFNFRMARALEKAGHRVDVIHFSTIPKKFRGSRSACSLLVLGRILKKPPDLLLVSKSYSFMGPLRVLLPILRIPVLYMVHHLEWHDRNDGASRFRKSVVKWFLRGGSKIWVNSGSTASDVAALGIPMDRISVVPPGYDPFPVPDMSGRKLPVKILSIGTLCQRKNQLTLVKSCLEIADLDFELHILGDESADQDYSRRVREFTSSSSISDRVFFHGHLTVEELHGFYGKSHILANLSRWEGYGMAVAEALQSGLPVVAANAGAVTELIENGVQGFLVPPDDSSACGECLGKLVTSGTLREELSTNALKRAADLFTWQDSEKEFVRLAESMGSHKEKDFG